MSPLHVQFQFLRLAKLFPAEVAERPRAPGVGGAAVSAVHVEVVETKEVLKEGRKGGSRILSTKYSLHACSNLFAVLALIRSFSVVLCRGVFHDVFFA